MTLIEEAKIKFPVGTRFNSTGGNKNCLIESTSVFISEGNTIRITDAKGGLIGRVYNGTKWAEIISTPTISTISKPDNWYIKLNRVGSSHRVIEYLNKNYSQSWNGESNSCYGVIDGESRCSDDETTSWINNGAIKITLEEFDKWFPISINPCGEIPLPKKSIPDQIGKWYKTTTPGGSIYYGKLQFFSETRDIFTSSECKVSEYKVMDYNFCNGYKWELVTDLTEIQSFLPAGHSDLIQTQYLDDKGRALKTYLPGEWYTNPLHPDNAKYKYFRVKSVEVIKSKGLVVNVSLVIGSSDAHKFCLFVSSITTESNVVTNLCVEHIGCTSVSLS